MFKKEYYLYKSGDYGYKECRIPALLVTGKGTILAFNEGRKNNGRDSDQIDLLLRRSTNNGKSFDEPIIVESKSGFVSGNPAPVYDRVNDKIWLIITRNECDAEDKEPIWDRILKGESPRTVWISSSDDDGLTWSEFVEITDQVKPNNWSWYATGPGHGIQLQSGRLVIPCDHFEMAHPDPTDDYCYSHIIYSDDYGKTWNIGGSTDKKTNECIAIETADGHLCVNSRNQSPKLPEEPFYRKVSWSSDGGLTFAPFVRDAGLPEPVCQASLCRYSLEVEDGKNRVLFSNPSFHSKGSRRNMTVKLSYDECRTWPISKVICHWYASYSDLCVTQDKTICCLYERGKEKDPSFFYSGDIVFVRFDLEYLTDGRDM